MKVLLFLVFLSLAVMVGMIFLVVTQELRLHSVRVNTLGEEDLIKKKEAEVKEIKLKVKELKNQQLNAVAHVSDLNGKKEKAEKSLMAFEAKLQNCNKEKDDSMMKKATVEANITKLKAEQEKAKSRADAELEKLKQQIFQRDQAICPFADMSKTEAQVLCDKQASA